MTFDIKKTAAFGAGFGVAVVIATAAAYWLTSRPKGWDSNSIKCPKLTVLQTFTDVPANPHTGEVEHFEGSGFSVEFILENHTRNDYTVPQDLKLFTRDDRSSALSELKVTFDHPYVIPANERAEVDANVEYSCVSSEMDTGKRTEQPEQECFNDEFGHVAEFVGFDYVTHKRLDLPRPTFSKGYDAAATALAK